MTPERWQLVERVYYEVLARDEPLRGAFLAEVCAADEPLRSGVAVLLAQQQNAGSFLETPAMEVAARKVVDESNAFLAGRQIGKFTILSRLGAGAMGERLCSG